MISGVPFAGVGWNDALTQEVDIEPDAPDAELAAGGGELLVSATRRIGIGADVALRGSSSSSLSEDESQASSHSDSRRRKLMLEREPRALELRTTPGREAMDVPDLPEDVRNKVDGSAMYGLAECGRAGGAVGFVMT